MAVIAWYQYVFSVATCNNDVGNFEVRHSVFEHRQRIQVVARHHVAHVSVDEHLSRPASEGSASNSKYKDCSKVVPSEGADSPHAKNLIGWDSAI